jgi:hypothetical protein
LWVTRSACSTTKERQTFRPTIVFSQL